MTAAIGQIWLYEEPDDGSWYLQRVVALIRGNYMQRGLITVQFIASSDSSVIGTSLPGYLERELGTLLSE